MIKKIELFQTGEEYKEHTNRKSPIPLDHNLYFVSFDSASPRITNLFVKYKAYWHNRFQQYENILCVIAKDELDAYRKVSQWERGENLPC